jgi:HEAT repeat protein
MVPGKQLWNIGKKSNYIYNRNMKKNDDHGIDLAPSNSHQHLVDLINELTDDSDFKKKHNARNTLVKMGKTIIPELHKLLASKNVLIRKEVVKVVELIADLRSIPLLISLLDDQDFDIRWIASEGLIRIGRKSLIPLLKAISTGKNSLFLDRRAHQILNSLLNQNEKEQFMALMLCLDNYHELGETAPVEASKALKLLRT